MEVRGILLTPANHLGTSLFSPLNTQLPFSHISLPQFISKMKKFMRFKKPKQKDRTYPFENIKSSFARVMTYDRVDIDVAFYLSYEINNTDLVEQVNAQIPGRNPSGWRGCILSTATDFVHGEINKLRVNSLILERSDSQAKISDGLQEYFKAWNTKITSFVLQMKFPEELEDVFQDMKMAREFGLVPCKPSFLL